MKDLINELVEKGLNEGIIKDILINNMDEITELVIHGMDLRRSIDGLEEKIQ
ncbi:MAG: hypothetical protein N4A40_09890 [Tissierellales bacterium]|jgi:hypothetical protein|nr:hypothetical protein [Tissierellales bacterium]